MLQNVFASVEQEIIIQFVFKIVIQCTEIINKCVWLQMVTVEMDSNLKKGRAEVSRSFLTS